MAQLSAEKVNFTGDVVSIKRVPASEVTNTSDVVVLGYDSAVHIPETGPVDLANLGRPLLERQAQGVAAVAVSNVIEFPAQLRKFEHNVEVAVEDGVLDLEAQYPNETPEARVMLFAKEVVQEQLEESDEAILANAGVLKMTIEEQDEAHAAEIKVLQAQIKDRDRLLVREKAAKLEILRTVRESGAPDDVVEKIEMLAGLTPAPRIAELLEAQTEDSIAESESRFSYKAKGFLRKALSGAALKMTGTKQPRIIAD